MIPPGAVFVPNGYLYRALDIVRTPGGGVAIVTETNDNGVMASLEYFGGLNPKGEYNAWWRDGDGLIVIDSLPHLLARTMAHPFGSGRCDLEVSDKRPRRR
jgi:hypothetical protein